MDPDPTTGKSILVVDDEPLNGDSLALLLRVQGHTVAVARSGKEALALLNGDPLPDLILLDLLMPVMSGWEFRERQRQDARLAAVPVVVLSAVGEAAERQDVLGDVGYLQKPIDPDKLAGAIRRFTVARKPVVLVVDDEAMVGNMLDVALRRYGFAVCVTNSGAKAVEVYGRDHTGIDVVLLDVQMPGMDGPETFAALKLINPHVRVCFMSGHTGRYSVGDLYDMQAWHVLPKPFVSLPLLAQTLWSMVGADTAHAYARADHRPECCSSRT